MVLKKEYQNLKTKEVREFDVDADSSGHVPKYIQKDDDEWKAVSGWNLKVVNSSEFFRAAHENTVRFTKPPLEGDSMPYGIT